MCFFLNIRIYVDDKLFPIPKYTWKINLLLSILRVKIAATSSDTQFLHVSAGHGEWGKNILIIDWL